MRYVASIIFSPEETISIMQNAGTDVHLNHTRWADPIASCLSQRDDSICCLDSPCVIPIQLAIVQIVRVVVSVIVAVAVALGLRHYVM